MYKIDCLAGHDAQQNELLVKRHLGKEDIYIYADLRGAASTIVKNPKPDQPGAASCLLSLHVAYNIDCLAGHDAQQNELLVKRHLGKGDIYIHANLRGAASTIVKNPKPDQPGGPASDCPHSV